MIGVRPDRQKELLAVEDGYRESAESWKTVLRELKRRGMVAPVLAVGDGALGFWAAARAVWPETREQGCWCHKLSNVLDSTSCRTPKSKRGLLFDPLCFLQKGTKEGQSARLRGRPRKTAVNQEAERGLRFSNTFKILPTGRETRSHRTRRIPSSEGKGDWPEIACINCWKSPATLFMSW